MVKTLEIIMVIEGLLYTYLAISNKIDLTLTTFIVFILLIFTEFIRYFEKDVIEFQDCILKCLGIRK
jgi:hypothetical protein